MTKKYAVLGSPIEHSKSPAIHTAAFAELGVEASYEKIELAGNLSEFVSSLDDQWAGLSLTMPLKEQALALAARADTLAIVTGAANTLIRSEAGWDAYNTDVFGIQMAVNDLKYKSVGVIGSGATARSAIVAMQELGKEVTVWARNGAAVKSIAAEFEVSVAQKFHHAAAKDLVISTLPALTLDQYLAEIRGNPENALLDVAYAPWPSKAAALWSNQGTAISGLEMLIWQAVGQQRLFAGSDLYEPLKDEKAILAAIRSALEVAK
jgi:shikimate dehydrogenase